jgi:hypothetical protein
LVGCCVWAIRGGNLVGLTAALRRSSGTSTQSAAIKSHTSALSGGSRPSTTDQYRLYYDWLRCGFATEV